MERVPQRVLNWLHSVLIGEYSDVNRTFSDVAQTIESFNTLRPSTDVYTFENGSSALLLHLTGTLPVSFRGGRYSFPVSIWIPKSYPNEAPIAFVTPTQEMVVRPGQHISGEGRIYHPYLAHWNQQSQVLELVRVLQDIFSREPPVVAKPASQRVASQPIPSGPPKPPLPDELRRYSGAGSQVNGPPPPPPKPFEPRPTSVTNQPPVPPRPSQQSSGPSPIPSRYTQAAPPPWQQPPPQNQSPSPAGHFRGQPTTAPHQNHQYQQQHQPTYMQPTVNQGLPQPIPQQIGSVRPVSQQQQPLAPQYQQQPPVQYIQQPQNYAPPDPKPKQPTMDLLTSPFDPPLPTHTANLPAPVIPPNPEKNALLAAISRALTAQLQSSITANESAVQSLSVQHAAMSNALNNLQHERNSLLHLQALLDQNEKILHQAMRDADECIASAQHQAVPGVDEVLVAPTVVGQQLYDLIADEKACIDTREVLARALDRGRISSETWVKTVRSLAREEFLKKVLIRRCAEGMGLQRGPVS